MEVKSKTVSEVCGGQKKQKVLTYGLSLDGGFGFPVRVETTETIMVETAPGRYRACIIRKFRNNE